MKATSHEVKPWAMPWVIVVGGFLGAGKTTLLLSAARELESRGLRSALILNDQGEALVDTEYASLNHLPNGEVTGGCFCCRFSELVSVMEQMRAHAPDVIFAEPVGSCTDISATTLQPLREYADQFRLAPFTVLVDPARAKELTGHDADPHLSFLFRKQLEEADLVCFTKSDLYPGQPESIPDGLAFSATAAVRQISAKTGAGVAPWLDEVLSGTLSVGSHILNIDYAEYARSEAALAWLNLQVTVELAQPLSSAGLLGPMLDRLDAEFTDAGISIVHMKAIVQSDSGYLKAAVCGNGQEPAVEGALDASPALRHELLLNLRAVGAADEVEAIIESNIHRIPGQLKELRIACFHPAAPTPERRIDHVTVTQS